MQLTAHAAVSATRKGILHRTAGCSRSKRTSYEEDTSTPSSPCYGVERAATRREMYIWGVRCGYAQRLRGCSCTPRSRLRREPVQTVRPQLKAPCSGIYSPLDMDRTITAESHFAFVDSVVFCTARERPPQPPPNLQRTRVSPSREPGSELPLALILAHRCPREGGPFSHRMDRLIDDCM
ncbi:hypothetical protein HYPSUDRAFT_40654 [Hypholoma sublateritium FD-334 SS-4]|uniref:Uncharacterized protein n=1 Tax=Hypholoma sublateritium (strain FD-334 SS-4) TaxID=945553 RepID=A0A0D2P2B2_HYPSF|nr:hypothetical protein HYPSUDRAFT_40654 [Hypholoma sublateritium FD-334 SS-4]